MSIQPHITFKAGRCEYDAANPETKVKPSATPGYIYLYTEDEMLHFCWRPRSARMDEPELDLIMFPEDGSFVPYTGGESSGSSDNLKSPTNGRVFVLKFNSSSQRHLFWLQSKSQGAANWFSPRDQKLGQIVDMLLSGENINVQDEIRDLRNRTGDDDDDEAMEDVEGTGAPGLGPGRARHGSGGAGPDATGGDVREEGHGSREGGADGGRAAASGSTDANTAVQNFLRSLQGSNLSGGNSSRQQANKPFTTLPDLLLSSITIPIIDNAPTSLIDSLALHLPPTILLLAQEIDDPSTVDPTSDVAQAAIEALSTEQKRDILRRVLRSPQLHQSLGSLTMALRDGGLPTVSEALKVKVPGGGMRGQMPLGGGEAVEAFLEGVKKTVEEEKGEEMETD